MFSGRPPSRRRSIAPWALLLLAPLGLIACGSCWSGRPTGKDDGTDPPAFQEPDPQQVAFGARLYRAHGCVTCHTIDGRSSTGPSFLGAYGQPRVLTNGRRIIVDDAYLRRSIREPSAEIIAGYTNQMIRYTPELLTETELDALVAFIISLRDRPDDAPPEDAPADPSIEDHTPPPTSPELDEQAPSPAVVDESHDASQNAEPASPLRLRPDGRPGWWLDRPRAESGRVTVSGESLGTTLREAGDLALDRARHRLRMQLNLPDGASIPDEQVERTLVIPLPNPGGAYRFAGYVNLSGIRANTPRP